MSYKSNFTKFYIFVILATVFICVPSLAIDSAEQDITNTEQKTAPYKLITREATKNSKGEIRTLDLADCAD